MQGSPSLKDYKTVSDQSEIEIVISKSRFIGRCYPCSSEDDAISIIDSIRKKHWDASHNCFAYSIGSRGERARFSDDGEPSGTAGAPMMEAIRNLGVTNVLCVVTRYFGGILLGTGGLVRAYGRCCADTVRNANIVNMIEHEEYAFIMPYPMWAKLSDMFAYYGTIQETDFSDVVKVKVWIPAFTSEMFLHEVSERTDAKVLGERMAVSYRPYRENK
ncbi:MAG: YigZ family protein [Eubacteriales bacterium]|nr:YigZ family protein [Eubacteriales bacterium]